MSKGLLYIAFGKEYIRLAESTIPFTQRFTSLPITVLVNRSCKIKGVNIVTLKMKDAQNREVKTRMNQYTPYQKTLYLDVDAVIQRNGIEQIFDFENDIMLNLYIHWKLGDRTLNIYDRAMRMFGVGLPLNIYNGAFILFKRDKCQTFFRVWHEYWRKFGKGREMPPLACALRNSGVSYGNFKIPIAVDTLDPEAMIQHDCNGFINKFGFPRFTRQTPFDSNPQDFKWSS